MGQMGDPTFSSTVLPILQQSCATTGCHAPPAPNAGLALDARASLLAGSDSGEAVIPFSPERSLMIEMLRGEATSTPDHATLLAEADIAAIESWIGDGCPDDLGVAAFADVEDKVYVTGQGADTLSVIGVDELVVIRTVPVEPFPSGGLFAAPHFGAVTPDGSWIVTMLQAPGVWKYDAGDMELERLQTTRPMAALTAVTPDGGKAYVTHFINPQAPAPGFVTIIDLATLEATGEIQVLYTPHGIAMSPDGSEVYVANWGSDHITVIDTATDQVTTHIPIAERVRGDIESFSYRILQIAAHPTQPWIYASCTTSPDSPAGEIRVVDRTQGMAVDSLAVAAGSAAPWHLKVTPDGSKLYVANRGQQLTGGAILDGTVSVYTTSPFALVTTITDPSLALPHGLDFDADGRYCFVSSENLNGAYTARHPIDGEDPGVVTVIDTATDQVVKVLEVEAFATGVFATR
jgi:YVTN family beta-propeller protein